MKKDFLAVILLAPVLSIAQRRDGIVSGPLLGHTELRTANIWVQFSPHISSASILFRQKKSSEKLKMIKKQMQGGEFNTAMFTLTALEPGKTYKYYIAVKNEKQFIDSGEVTTQSLWQGRNPAPDFRFITGSCAYFNEPVYDRPGKPYGQDSSIFKTMANEEKSSFMLWLGDNWYTREVDYYSDWGLYYRASQDRSSPALRDFLKAMPHYAIWDDHDYGPNDADKSYVLKNTSRNVFMQYWGNPSYGMKDEGIHTKFTWNDVDFFLLDDRWFRSNDEMPDSINGIPNEAKKMFGDEQMEWLKNSLLHSKTNTKISFRIIVTGSQVLNPVSPYNCFRHYPVEYNKLMKFIADSKINGVLFVTGDRHHSEIIKVERTNAYPLFDITVSPLTSGAYKATGPEENNPFRVSKETSVQNYAKFSFSGTEKDRKLNVDFIGTRGETLDSWSILLKNVSF